MHRHSFFKRWFFAVDIGRDKLKRQRPFNEHYLAIGAMRYSLSLNVKRLNCEQVGWVFLGCGL